MPVWSVALLLICYRVCEGQEAYMPLTTKKLVHMDYIENVAAFGDAAHRGPNWKDYATDSTDDSDDSDLESEVSAVSSLDTTVSDSSSEYSHEDASSVSTKEKYKHVRKYRDCTPCPHDMLKKFKNFGIKWICGGYQRARRSFKSICMMRFRNCQDGTMFVKLYDHRCEENKHHGRSWFYHYKV